MVVEELVALLGFDFDDKDLKKFDKGMKDAKKLLLAVGTAAAASAGAIFAFTSKIAETNDELGKQAQTLGIATAELQAWQYSAELGGASANSMTSSLENLSRRASEAARGIGSGVEVFGMLGISATDANGRVKESSQLMEEVADRVAQLDTQSQKLEFLDKLGISSNLLLTLNQGSEALRQQRLEAKKLGFTLSENAAKDAADFNDALLKAKKVVGGVANSIAQDLMPGITELMTSFKEWFVANKKLIKQNLKKYLDGIKKGITVVWNVAKRFYRIIDTIVQGIGGWEVAIKALGTAFLLMYAKMLALPILIAAIVVAVGLLIDDLITYFQGGESAIGDLVEKFPMLETALDGLKFVLEVIGEAIQRVFDGTIIDSFIESFHIIKNFLASVMLDSIKAVKDAFQTLGETIYKYVMMPINSIKDALNYIKNIEIPNPFDEISNPFGDGGSLDFLNPFSSAPTPQAVTSNNRTISSPMNFNADINVTGAGGNAEGVATNIRDTLDKWWLDKNKTAVRNLQGSVVR